MTTTYTFEQLKEDVRKEAEALRVHATKEERERLDVKTFIPSMSDHCIYGMIAKKCWSPRAAELIELCTVRYFNPEAVNQTIERGIDGIISAMDGSKVSDFVSTRTKYITKAHFSAIEVYILLPEARNENLIAFLRGETETLEL